jgi:hypothetical protein
VRQDEAMQTTLDFDKAERHPIRVRYSAKDQSFFAITPLDRLPDSFLLESRAQRIGASVSEMRAMRVYDLQREIAEERSILGLGSLDETCRVSAVKLNYDVISAAAKREASERIQDFKDFMKSKTLADKPLNRSRKGGGQ